jgi:hypothetical protein
MTRDERRTVRSLRAYRVRLAWYGVTQRLSKLREAWHPVLYAASVDELAARIKGGALYVQDPRGDRMRHPCTVQRALDEGRAIGDCEDHVGYELAVILRSGLARRAWFGRVGMRAADGTCSIHAIAVYVPPFDSIPHVLDYGRTICTGGLASVGELVALSYSSTCLGAVFTPVWVSRGDATIRFLPQHTVNVGVAS